MDNRSKRKYLKRARIVLKRRERENTLSINSEPNESLQADTSQDISIHVETNKELKRLLLASVGYDLHQQMETLINEKTHLQSALNRSTSQLDSITEEADHLSIESDIWRSKCLASRVMIDELMRYKMTTSATYSEFIRSINMLLGERHELGRQVALCNTMLQQCLVYMNKADGLFVRGHGNVIDVAAINARATKQLMDSVTNNEEIVVSPDKDTFDLSYGEQLAQQVLSASHSEVKQPSSSLLPHLSVSERHLLQRANNVEYRSNHYRHHQPDLLWTRQESYSIHYCKNCRGKVFIV